MSQTSATVTDLEKCMENLIVVFHRYAKEEGDASFLRKKDLKKLLEAEMPTFLNAQKDPKAVDKIMNDLDQNKDDKVDFLEFLSFVSGLSMACEKCFMLHNQKKATK